MGPNRYEASAVTIFPLTGTIFSGTPIVNRLEDLYSLLLVIRLPVANDILTSLI